MSVDTATSAQIEQVNDFSRLVRSIMIDCAKVTNHMNVAMIAWNNGVSAIIATPNGTTIDDGNGLAGASEMTDTLLAALVGYITATLVIANTPDAQASLVAAIGPNNMIG